MSIAAAVCLLVGGATLLWAMYGKEAYDFDIIGLAAFFVLGGLFLVAYIFLQGKSERREAEKRANNNPMQPRKIDPSKKGKVFLEADVEGYKIIYRRVGFVNELVVNGYVYDEMKAVLEFAHKLTAHIDGHTIEAGLQKDDVVYINFDGENVDMDLRNI